MVSFNSEIKLKKVLSEFSGKTKKFSMKNVLVLKMVEKDRIRKKHFQGEKIKLKKFPTTVLLIYGGILRKNYLKTSNQFSGKTKSFS